MYALHVALLAVCELGTLEAPARLLAVVADRDRQETEHWPVSIAAAPLRVVIVRVRLRWSERECRVSRYGDFYENRITGERAVVLRGDEDSSADQSAVAHLTVSPD